MNNNPNIVSAVSHHPLYHTWWNMMQRCYNKRSASYDFYGALGTRVDQHWHVFDNFLKDVSATPRPKGYTLDRINPNQDYGPNNWRWASRRLQSLNTRKPRASGIKGHGTRASKLPLHGSSRVLTANGITQPVSFWAKSLGCSAQALLWRVDKGGLTEQEAVDAGKRLKRRAYAWEGNAEIPGMTGGRGMRLVHNGETLTVKEWGVRQNLRPSLIRNRILKGWTVEQALGFAPRPHGNAKPTV